MPLDTDVFDKIKTFADYQKADQAFQLQKALQAQQLQTGGIDAASKANIYGTQVLSGAVAGGQASYDQARQQLQGMGIDTSGYAPDAATAAKQLDAARLAQSPLGTLLNASQKDQANAIALGGLTGTITPNAKAPTLPTISGITGSAPQSAPPASPITPVQPAISAPPQPMQVNATTPASNDLALLTGPSGIGATPGDASGYKGTPSIADAAAGANADLATTTQTTPVSNVSTGAQPPTVPQFSFRPQGPNETLPAYKDAQQQAFEQFKINNAGPIAQATAQGGAAGKAAGEQPAKAAAGEELYARIGKNLDAMLSVNDQVPQSKYFVPSGMQAAISQNIPGYDNQSAANAYNSFSKVNKAQVLNGLQELVNTGAIRNSRPLIQLVSDVNAIDENASPASRAQQIGAVRAELNNLKTSAENVDSKLNGGPLQPYQDIPMATTASPVAPPTVITRAAYDALPAGASYIDRNGNQATKGK